MHFKHDCGESFEIPDELMGTKAECPSCSKPFDVPPIDVSKPVENPGLCAAIDRLYKNGGRSAELKVALQGMLRSYLLVVAVVELPAGTPAATVPGAKDPQLYTFPPGARIGFIVAEDKSGRPFLPVFTDWKEVAAFRGETANPPGWTGFVMPWSGIESLLAQQPDYAAVVLNPAGGRTLTVPRDATALLRSDLDAAMERLVESAADLPPKPPAPPAEPVMHRHSCGLGRLIEPAEAGETITCKQCGENFQAPLPAAVEMDSAFKRAIKRFAEAPDETGNRREFFRLLVEAALIVGCDLQVTNGGFVPAGRETDAASLPKGTAIRFSQVTDADGLELLAAFTDWQRRDAFSKRFSAMSMPARAALTAVVKGECAGLVLNPKSDPAFLITKQQAQSLLNGDLPPA